MNTPGVWDDAQIHAFVDGELDAATAAQLTAACRQDSILNARVQRQRSLRADLQAKFDPVLEEPVPARLLDAMQAAPVASVAPIRTARPALFPAQPLWLGALAASLVIGLAIGWFAPRDGMLPVSEDDEGLLVATGYLDKALSQTLSAEGRNADGVQVALTFRGGDGAWCRSFSLASGADGLACRTGKVWSVEVLGQTGAAPQGQDYRQAGSTLSPAVLAAISERQSGDTLDAEQERDARAGGWRRVPAAGK